MEDKERVGLSGGWALFPLENGEDDEVLMISEVGFKVMKLDCAGWSSQQVMWKMKQ